MMILVEKLKTTRWRWLIAGVALVLCGALLLTLFPLSSLAASQEEEAVYKDAPVTRGDLTVGVTESGTATLDTATLKYADVAVTLEEVFVKAGQTVAEGDSIAQVSTDDVADQLAALQLKYDKAVVALNQANLEKQLSDISAASEYDQSVAAGEVAEDQYAVSMDDISDSLSSARTSLENQREQIEGYEDDLDGLEGSYNLDGLKAAWDQAQADYDGLKEKYDAQEKAPAAAETPATPEAGADAGTDAGAAAETPSADGSVTIDTTITEDDLAVAKAQIETAKTAYQQARTKYAEESSSLEEKLDSAEEKYSEAKSSYEKASNSRLVEEYAAQSTLDTTLAKSETAKSVYDITLAQTANSLASQELEVKELAAELATLQESLGDGILRAPCSGLVMSVSAKAGDDVAAGTTIATISNSANVYVSVSIDQEDIGDIAIGKEANVLFASQSDSKFTGVVDSISTIPARAGSSTVSYTVSVKLDGDASSIYEGMTGDVTFITKELQDVLYVSNKAVSTEGTKQLVKVRDANGEIQQVEVTTGFSDGKNVEISSGLAEGDVALIESRVTQAAAK